MRPQNRIMAVVLEIHLVVAFLLALCALIFSWNASGLRVVTVVATLQFVLGLIAAGMFGASHVPMPPQLWVHIVLAVVILGVYGMAQGMAKRAGRRGASLALGVTGIVLIVMNILLGWHMAGRM